MNMKRVFENYKKQCRAEGRSEGLSEGISQGISQGMIEGRLETLTTLLRKKFGQLQADILQKLNTATEEQLKLWSENILDAKTLPEVFRPLN
jgi:flagellar biosynthesis/type III secretory pathway protein FliH